MTAGPALSVDSWPRVTVVTPSLDQGRFLGDTLASVRAQTYPHLEHLVIDGGSRDQTLAILRQAGGDSPALRWVSEPDGGQSDAINKGFRRARGEILAWLNADDIYTPDAVEVAVRSLRAHPEVGLVYGRGEIIDHHGAVVGPFTGWEPFSLWRLLHVLDYILQPATFFRRHLVEAVGYLDTGLSWAMDWDLWIRLAARAEVRAIDRLLARAREHAETKTATGGWRRVRELGRLMRRHSGRFWTPGVRLYACDTAHRWLGARLPGALGRRLQRRIEGTMAGIGRRLPVHADGWLGPEAELVVPRRWRRARVVLEALDWPAGGFEVVIAGGSTAVVRLDGTGAVEAEVEVPAGDGPFARLGVTSAHSFRPPAPDGRRLSVLCRSLRPVHQAAAHSP